MSSWDAMFFLEDFQRVVPNAKLTILLPISKESDLPNVAHRVGAQQHGVPSACCTVRSFSLMRSNPCARHAGKSSPAGVAVKSPFRPSKSGNCGARNVQFKLPLSKGEADAPDAAAIPERGAREFKSVFVSQLQLDFSFVRFIRRYGFPGELDFRPQGRVRWQCRHRLECKKMQSRRALGFRL